MQEEAEKILSSMGVKEGHLRNLSIHCRDDAPISPDVAAYSEGQKSLFNALTAYKSFIKVNGADNLSFSDVPVIFSEKEMTGSCMKL
ncbi:hypothetical protein J2S74_000052 [Evansella vedderi]|uniref:Uncharacterized protein n=1 Tax=Evansella vedderi TaxID=38282 RepID=A0ABT9ZP15_9BACI|nr:hypothetical protein [Evansella vedderi]MDQ0252680.1 hypothetical protein [Evansella vedderi]